MGGVSCFLSEEGLSALGIPDKGNTLQPGGTRHSGSRIWQHWLSIGWMWATLTGESFFLPTPCPTWTVRLLGAGPILVNTASLRPDTGPAHSRCSKKRREEGGEEEWGGGERGEGRGGGEGEEEGGTVKFWGLKKWGMNYLFSWCKEAPQILLVLVLSYTRIGSLSVHILWLLEGKGDPLREAFQVELPDKNHFCLLNVSPSARRLNECECHSKDKDNVISRLM